MNKTKKPTSPHLQIYRWSMASFGSIMHRFTGIAIYFASIAICIMIIYYGNYHQVVSIQDSADCKCAMMKIKKYITNFISFSFVFALFYHLFNGIRHLCWDFLLKGFDKNIAKINAILVLALAFIFSIVFIYFFNFI